MIYLLAKYALLFLLVAVSSYVFGSWMTRRKYVDVSESYEELRAAGQSDAASWDRLWSRFDSLQKPMEVNDSNFSKRLDKLANVVSNFPRPEPVDLESIEVGIDEVKRKVGAIPIPLSHKPVNLDPISHKLVDMDAKVEALQSLREHIPVDIAPLSARLEKVEKAIRAVSVPAPQVAPDLSPIQVNLASISEDIRRLPVVETHQPVDLEPFDRRLCAIETELRAFRKSLAAYPRGRDKQTEPKRSEPRILSAALYGKKDDLRLISGIGPKLERLLNKNGVYYFWQLADWTRQDINVMDERLDTFKGRIGRDDWVSQAKQLRRQTGAAQQPEMT